MDLFSEALHHRLTASLSAEPRPRRTWRRTTSEAAAAGAMTLAPASVWRGVLARPRLKACDDHFLERRLHQTLNAAQEWPVGR